MESESRATAKVNDCHLHLAVIYEMWSIGGAGRLESGAEGFEIEAIGYATDTIKTGPALFRESEDIPPLCVPLRVAEEM